MKKSGKRILSFLVAAAMLITANLSIDTTAFADAVNAASKMESKVYPMMIPKEASGKSIPLSAEYFEMRMGWKAGELAAVTITSLPKEGSGKLMLDGVEVEVYDTIFRSELDRLCYVQDEDALQASAGWFSFIPLCSTDIQQQKKEKRLCATFQVIPKDSERPLVQDVFCRTLPDTQVYAALQCMSQPQRQVVYTINKKPQKGTVNFLKGRCIYTPNPKARGTDHFVLTALDNKGGISSPIQVNVAIGEFAKK